MIKDPMGTLDERVYSVLSAVNPNTMTNYPPQVFAGGKIDLPITVYTVEATTAGVRVRNETRVRCTVSVDTFGRNRKQAGETAADVRRVMLGVLPTCDMDRYYDSPQAGIVRRSQRFTGYMDLCTGIVYAN